MRNILLAAMLGASVLAGAPGFAQMPPPPPPAGPPGAGPADTDRDGILTRAEATAEADRRFAAIDANRDGKVTADEMRAERERHRAERRAPPPPPPGADRPDHRGMKHAMGKRLDPDRDGAATKAEWMQRAADRFAREDANRDGRIDANERSAMREMRRMHRIGDAPPPPAPNGDAG